MVTREDIVEQLKTVIDPELYIDVWTLGLIYDISISEEGEVGIRMTFTSIACPAGPQLVEEVRSKVLKAAGVTKSTVEVVFVPPWEPSEELKAMLGIG